MLSRVRSVRSDRSDGSAVRLLAEILRTLALLVPVPDLTCPRLRTTGDPHTAGTTSKSNRRYLRLDALLAQFRNRLGSYQSLQPIMNVPFGIHTSLMPMLSVISFDVCACKCSAKLEGKILQKKKFGWDFEVTLRSEGMEDRAVPSSKEWSHFQFLTDYCVLNSRNYSLSFCIFQLFFWLTALPNRTHFYGT